MVTIHMKQEDTVIVALFRMSRDSELCVHKWTDCHAAYATTELLITVQATTAGLPMNII